MQTLRRIRCIYAPFEETFTTDKVYEIIAKKYVSKDGVMKDMFKIVTDNGKKEWVSACWMFEPVYEGEE